ncbi:unnamed protein product [Sphagnum jensenii]|uniref:Probable magnesium transporter n=1 Tax=Sphagnum jensenii TaxID=128206 RepID=A0ABP1BJV2_9BRYO
MGEWITGAAINVLGSVSINFGTNLLKLGHNQRERLALAEAAETGEKAVLKKPITHFQAWRVGVVVFMLGNILNFISFGYAAQSLLAALGSVQFVTNVFFAYVLLNEVVTRRIVLATIFIMAGNVFLVAFGNHQSLIYTHEELLASYKGHAYLVYCLVLILLVALHHVIYRRGRILISAYGEDGVGPHWWMLLPYAYSVVSGAIGSHSVLFAKSLSILLRLSMEGDNQLDEWFTYLVLLLFVGTASFWMARLNDGLAMFDAILIVPMLQIAWTFFSIFTGFIYFEEYRVFDRLRSYMFAVGIFLLFLGMSLLAPQGSRGAGTKNEDDDETESVPLMADGVMLPTERREASHRRSFVQSILSDAALVVGRAKSACRMSVGLGQDRVQASSVFAMPMLASSRTQWRTPNLNSEWLSGLTNEVRKTTSDLNTMPLDRL